MNSPNESTQQLATAIGALTIALLDKGLLTQEEYDRAYIQAQQIVSQESARQRDEEGQG
jgi:predicted RNA-binding protein associated with RNAse of E/G family